MATAYGIPLMPDEQVQDTSARPERPALSDFNRLFHDSYSTRAREACRQLESGETPVVVRMDDRLLFQSNGGATEYEITGERYHELKAASHIPAAVYLALTGSRSHANRSATLAAGLDALQDLGPGAHAIVEATRALLEHAGRDPDLLEAALERYRTASRGALESLAREAAAMEIEALDRAMRDIEARLEREHLQKTYFVVCGGHQPRYKQLSKMYFKRWLADAGWPSSRISHHVIYAEGKGSLDEALGLVRTRLVDGELSAALFGDLVSLDEDVLGDAALEELGRRFGS